MANLRAELKAELDAAGLFDYQPVRVYLKFAYLVAIAVGLFALAVHAPSWWLRVPLFVAGISTNIALVMLGHDAGHAAVSRTKWVNDLLGLIAFPMIGGMSLSYWKYKHNTLHHSFPNVDKKDPDIKIYPFAMHTEQRTERGFTAFVQRFQGLAFWPLTTMTTFAMRIDGLLFHFGWGKRLAPPRDRALDLLAMTLHYVCWLVVPTLVLGLPLLPVLAFYCAWSMCAGVLLAAIFLPAHITLPFFRKYDENFVLQLRTTQNLNTNPLFSFLLMGLDHQVEHHLFQRLSHLSAKKAAPIVRAFCQRKGLPYHEQGWGAALWDATKRLDRLPHYELLERPPKDDLRHTAADPVHKGAAEFSAVAEPPAAA